MKRKRNFKRFGIRALLVLTLVASLPAWWVATKRAEYANETRLIAQLQKEHPNLIVQKVSTTPIWLRRLGYSPPWFGRVWSVDVTGVMDGSKPVPAIFEDQIDFDDGDFKNMTPTLIKMSNLTKLYLPFTKTTDNSIPNIALLKSLDFINLQQTNMTSAAVRQLETDLPNAKIAFFHDPYWTTIGNDQSSATDAPDKSGKGHHR